MTEKKEAQAKVNQIQYELSKCHPKETSKINALKVKLDIAQKNYLRIDMKGR